MTDQEYHNYIEELAFKQIKAVTKINYNLIETLKNWQ